MKGMKILVAAFVVLGPMTMTMLQGGIHPGYILANILWIILLVAVHKLRHNE